jgi:O-acetylserine/cysteine efflux transporter
MAILVALIWGFNFIVIKFGLHSFPPLLFSALRFLCAALPAVLFVDRKRIPWKLIVQVGIVLGVIKYSLLYIGINEGMPAGLSSLTLQAQVPFTILLSVFLLGDRASRVQRIGIGIAIAGIAVIGYDRAGGLTMTGLMLVVCAAVAWAFANLLIKRSGGAEPFRLMVWMSLIPPLPLFILSLVTEHDQLAAVTHMGWGGLGALLYTGPLATVVAFGLWGRLLHTYSTSFVTPFALLVPVFGLAFSAVLLGEPLAPVTLLAAGMVLIGLVTVVLGPRLTAPVVLATKPVT